MSNVPFNFFPRICIRLKYSSLIYLVLSWLVTVSTALYNVNSSIIVLYLLDLTIYLQLLSLAVSLYFTWQWLKNLYTLARKLDSNTLTYKTGWAFWGWIVPIAFFWIPRRMIDEAIKVLNGSSSRSIELETKKWWTLWVISILIGNLSFRAFENQLNSVELLLLAGESILLSFAYPLWIKIVDTSNQLVSLNK